MCQLARTDQPQGVEGTSFSRRQRLSPDRQCRHHVGQGAVLGDEEGVGGVVADVTADEGKRCSLQSGRVPSGEPHRPVLGHAGGRSHLEQRRFPGGMGALDDHELSPRNPEGNRLEHGTAVALAAYSFEPKHPMIISETGRGRHFLPRRSEAARENVLQRMVTMWPLSTGWPGQEMVVAEGDSGSYQQIRNTQYVVWSHVAHHYMLCFLFDNDSFWGDLFWPAATLGSACLCSSERASEEGGGLIGTLEEEF
jgi:hypothetical protein